MHGSVCHLIFQGLDGRLADSLDPGQVVGVLEGAVGIAVLDDGAGLDLADAGQLGEQGGIGRIDVDGRDAEVLRRG